MLDNDDIRCGRDRRIDRIVTGKYTAVPLMLLLFCLLFWITVSGANLPSAWLSNTLFSLEEPLFTLCDRLHAPPWLCEMLVHGVYRVLAWIVAVMLPPMAIFFPLFTLLEDIGYLPRLAFNLDGFFQRAATCGKQALTMCMDNIILQSANIKTKQRDSYVSPLCFVPTSIKLLVAYESERLPCYPNHDRRPRSSTFMQYYII